MKKILNPKIVIPVVVSLSLIGMILYVLFAPETWWKPIYIRFDADTASAANGVVEGSTPEGGAASTVQPAVENHTPEASLTPGLGSHQPVGAAQQLVMPAIQPGQGVMYKLDPKVVNLAEPGGLRYLQVSLVLEFHPSVKEYYETKMSGETATEAQAASGHSGGESNAVGDPFQEAIDSMRPVIDDIVTTLFSSKTFKDIATIEGKQQLKQELMTQINTALGYQGVINIYFTDFVVQ